VFCGQSFSTWYTKAAFPSEQNNVQAFHGASDRRYRLGAERKHLRVRRKFEKSFHPYHAVAAKARPDSKEYPFIPKRKSNLRKFASFSFFFLSLTFDFFFFDCVFTGS
jgi:hypothetical protein